MPLDLIFCIMQWYSHPFKGPNASALDWAWICFSFFIFYFFIFYFISRWKMWRQRCFCISPADL